MIPQQPEVYTADQMRKWSVLKNDIRGCDGSDRTEIWIPARPEGGNIYGLTWRWKLAWKVLTGQYDALKWE